MIFWIVASGLLLLALLILVLPMLRTQSEAESNDRQQQNIDIARANKSVLDIQLSKHELSQQEYDSSLHDLETALALDLENTDCTARERHICPKYWQPLRCNPYSDCAAMSTP